jgi:hypothetical protein
MKKIFKSLLLCLLLPAFTYAQDLRGDSIDIKSYVLYLDLSDFGTKIMQGHAQIKVEGKVQGNTYINLDLEGLTVDSVFVDGMFWSFTHIDSILHIPLTPSFNTGDSATLDIYYHGHPLQMPGDFGGFYWDNTYAFNIGISFLATPHNYGRVWFPCYDNFVERSLYEFYVTTDSSRKAFCNGIMQGMNVVGNKKVWHWKLGQEIQSYLASVTVSDYTTLIDNYVGLTGNVPVELGVRPPDTTLLKNSFINLESAFHTYEDRFGPYQFDRVGYCIVPFTAGAMEHACNISYMRGLVNGNTAYETTMAHELSHHWFGDLITCDEADEMWLNEGWASYCEAVFLEGLYGRQSYIDEVKAVHDGVLHTGHIDDNGYFAVSGVPDAQTYGTTVYQRGAGVAHAMRSYMGDSLFFHCVKDFLTVYSFKNVNSEIFRDHLTQCSGVNMNDFFADWVFQPGFTHFSVDSYSVTPNGGTYGVEVFIKQRINHANHLYNHVPVTVTYFDADWNTRVTETAVVSGACGYYATNLNFSPAFIAIDFDELLTDAVGSDYMVINSTGNKVFDYGRVQLNVSQITDSAFIRVEHNWVAPERMVNPIPGLLLHDYRYWKIDGIIPAGFTATAKFDYNGGTSGNGYLDNTFISNSEDSLVVMYRPNAWTEWAFADSFVINKQGSATNKVGFANVYNVQKGEYCFAIWDYDKADTVNTGINCDMVSGIAHINPAIEQFKIYPNPAAAAREVTVEFAESSTYNALEVFDLMGRKVYEQQIEKGETKLQLNFTRQQRGSYIVTASNNSGQRVSKILVVK